MCSRSYVHLFETKLETPSLLLVLLSRSGSMAAQAHSPPTLRSLSRQSLRRDGAPLTHRARQRKPAWAVANTSKYCLQTASNSRPGANVSCRSTVCPLSARPHATATQITKFPPSCARHAHLAGTTVTARRRRAAPPCAASRDDREQRSRVAPARQKRWLLTPAGRRRVCTNSARQLRV